MIRSFDCGLGTSYWNSKPCNDPDSLLFPFSIKVSAAQTTAIFGVFDNWMEMKRATDKKHDHLLGLYSLWAEVELPPSRLELHIVPSEPTVGQRRPDLVCISANS